MKFVSLAVTLLVFKGLFSREDNGPVFVLAFLILALQSSVAILAQMEAFTQVVEMYALICFLLWCTPGQVMRGYSCAFDGTVLPYTLNGLTVLLLTVAFYATLVTAGLKDPTMLARNYWACFGWAVVIGLALSLLAHFKAQKVRPIDAKFNRCITRDLVATARKTEEGLDLDLIYARLPPNTNTFWLMEAFNGSWFNPRVAGVDVKMALYCIGAVILQLNVLSQAALHQQNNGGVIANSVFLYVSMFTWFLIEYSYFENVHLYTYDLFAEKIGIKLVFGCMAFYPFFYAIGGTVLTTYAPHRHPELFMQDLGPISCCAIVVLFVTGWVFTRGANMQKFYYKINPKDQTFLFGLLSQKTIPGSRIIASGFWGLSRHINYMGEIVQAVALALPGFFAFVGTDFSLALIPFLYPLYYLALFIPRERDDHVICKRKYGKVWDEYCARVPYRIVPGLY